MGNQSLQEELGLFLSIAEESELEKFITKRNEKGEEEHKFLSGAWQAGKAATKDIRDIGKMAVRYAGKHKGAVKTVGAAALIAGGVYAYHRFLSSAAKKCSDYAGSDKTECMKRVKAGATNAEIGELRKSMTLCNQSSDPLTCKKRLKDRVSKLSDQLYQIRFGSLLKD